jgi:hypothetical protein
MLWKPWRTKEMGFFEINKQFKKVAKCVLKCFFKGNDV